MRKKGWVYFARFGVDGPIKIGWALDPRQRVKNLAIGSPVVITLLGAMPCKNAESEETSLHIKLREHCVRGEWFTAKAARREMRRLHARMVAPAALAKHFRASSLYMAGLRADKKTLASWSRKAKTAGMSRNKWVQLMLNNAPDVKPAEISKERSQ